MLLSLIVLLCVFAEELVATNEPQFISKGRPIEVKEGTTLELPCLVSNLGEFVLLWKFNKTKVLFAGNLFIDRDDRISRNDSSGSLVIHNISEEYSGEYSCQISINPPKEIIYNVHVPRIIQDEFRNVKIRRFDRLNIDCKTRGGPTQIQWKRGAHLLSSTPSLIIERIDRDDTGTYTCTASNELGQSSRETRIVVYYKPEVHVSHRVINAPIGHTVIVECKVFGEPTPIVKWFKGAKKEVQPSDRVVVNRNETTTTLKIYDVIEDDYDTYVCMANNSFGYDSSNIVVISGSPSLPQFTSPYLSRQQTSYSLEWSLDSESPITQYVIRWKTRDEYEWSETRVEPQNQELSFKRSFSFELLSLEANKSYDVQVRAQNRFGETRSDIFTFATSLSHVCSPSA